jgi:hypothetical protein
VVQVTHFARQPPEWRRSWSGYQAADASWIHKTASAMHAQRGDLPRALAVEGLGCKPDTCPDGALPLSAALRDHCPGPLGAFKRP